MRNPWRKLVLGKLLASALLVSSCATVNGTRSFIGIAWPGELHGGDSGRPAAPDALFVGGGFVLDGALHAAHVPAVPRLAADVLAAWAVRVPRWGGRTEFVHGLVVSGAILRMWAGGILHAIRGH